MHRLLIISTLTVLGAGPGLADRVPDPESRGSGWRQPAPSDSETDRSDLELENRATRAHEPVPDRLRLYDERGHRTGRVERQDGFGGTMNLYDEKGTRTGRVRHNPVFEEEYDVYDDRGRRVQRVRKHPAFDDRYDIFDTQGRRVGSVRAHPWIEERYDIYDDRGRRIGRADAE
jgi:hypothetical protein